MLEILKLGIVNMIYLLGTFISFGYLFGILENLNNKLIFSAFGRIGIIVTGFIGTVVHETGHYLMCLIFRHKVIEVKLFRPFASSSDNVLGYVKHSYDKNNIYQNIGNFFIGVAPLIFGVIAILLLFKILLPDSYYMVKNNLETTKYIKSASNVNISMVLQYMLQDFFRTLKYIFINNNIISFRYWIFIFSMYSITTHMSLSKADLQGALSGVIAIFTIIMIVTFVAKIFNFNDIIQNKLIQFNVFVGCFMGVGLFFSTITLGISYCFMALLSFRN